MKEERERAKDDAHWKLESNKSRRQKSNGHFCVCDTVGQVLPTLWGPNVPSGIIKPEINYIEAPANGKHPK